MALRWNTLLLAVAIASGGSGCGGAGSATRGSSAWDPRSVELVLVKGGCYQMGAAADDCDAGPEEMPRHEVCVGDFRIGRTEVTQGLWRSVMGSGPSASTSCPEDDCPIDEVSFVEVQDFLARLNAKTGGRYRLPTEAEWEYAARSGGRDEKFAGGGELNRVAWFADNSGKRNHRVATKAPNGLGLYDMSGNVWEMTSDWYAANYYASSPRDNPPGPTAGDDHVVRGGCRTGGVLNQRTTRRTYVGDRTRGAGRGGNVGFRLAAPP